MPFFCEIVTYDTIPKKSTDSLQSNPLITPNKKKTHRKRVLQFFSATASMTAEATIALPLFLFTVFSVSFFIEVVRIQMDVGTELHQIGKKIAVYGYLYEKAEEKEILKKEIGTGLVTNAFCNGYVKEELKKALKKEAVEEPFIVGGVNGIQFFYSSYMKKNVIDIVAKYQIQIPFNFFGIHEIPVIQRARVRAWNGYDGEHGELKKEQMVYITPGGSVYHTEINCSYLNPSIKQVKINQISSLRNESGEKYYPCELCGENRGGNRAVYITNYGNRYHLSKTCSGIKRNIMVVPISQVKGRRPCSKCGGSK